MGGLSRFFTSFKFSQCDFLCLRRKVSGQKATTNHCRVKRTECSFEMFATHKH